MNTALPSRVVAGNLKSARSRLRAMSASRDERVAYAEFDYLEEYLEPHWWSVNNSAVWEFDGQFVGLSRCELYVPKTEPIPDWSYDGTHYAVMMDNLFVRLYKDR